MKNNNKLIIGTSGGEGSFSEEAAHYFCQKQKIKNYKLAYLISAEKVLGSLDRQDIDLGIF